MIVEAMAKGLKSLKKEHSWEEQVLHVSDLSVYLENGSCPRSLWYRVRNYPKAEETTGKKFMFYHGHRLHSLAAELIAKGLDDDWKIAGIEVDVSDNISGLTGRTDCIIKNKEDETMIIDFKTVRGNAFNFLDEVKPAHELQVQTYMMFTNADYGLVLYIDREGQNFAKEFIVKRNDAKVKEAIKYAKQVIMPDTAPHKLEAEISVRENKGDNSIYIKQPWQCDYCDYCGVSCKGALDEEYRDIKGIVAKEDKEGNIYAYKEEYNGLIPLIRRLRNESDIR